MTDKELLAMCDDSTLLEKLAELEHKQWWAWATTVANQEQISDARYERWKQCFIDYSKLTEENKEHNRKWARQALEIVATELKRRLEETGYKDGF